MRMFDGARNLMFSLNLHFTVNESHFLWQNTNIFDFLDLYDHPRT